MHQAGRLASTLYLSRTLPAPSSNFSRFAASTPALATSLSTHRTSASPSLGRPFSSTLNLHQISTRMTTPSRLNQRPVCPAHPGMLELDPKAFESSVEVLAVKVPVRELGVFNKDIRKSGEGLDLAGIKSVVEVEGEKENKWALLGTNDRDQLSTAVQQLIDGREVSSRSITLSYDFWTANEIIQSILPAELQKEAPTSFATMGHLIHLNLRDRYLPYKYVIANVLLSKVNAAKTVVNKLDTINESEFRTFPMEILAGPADFNVTMNESGIEFSFDFSKVYWNSRLSHEHERLIDMFNKGDIIADGFAGVGPFAVPAAKRGCFVYGNDLNPESAKSMEDNRKKNHIKDNLRVSCLDGREFIRGVVVANARRPWTPLELGPNGEVKTKRQEEKELAYKLLAEGKANIGDGKGGRKTSSSKGSKPPASSPHPPSGPPNLLYPSSPYIKHFIMNLPAMAVTFLDAFRGSYTGLPKDEWDKVEMPVVHCHFFDKRPLPADHAEEKAEQTLIDIASHHLGFALTRETPRFYLHKVRLVAPQKWMYCIGFELPREVAFSEVDA